MAKMIERFVRDERGGTAIEYGLIATLVCVAAIASITSLGTSLLGLWDKVASNVKKV